MNFLLRNGTNQLGNMSLRGNGTLTVDTLDSLGCYRSLDFTGNVKVAVGGKTCQYYCRRCGFRQAEVNKLPEKARPKSQ